MRPFIKSHMFIIVTMLSATIIIATIFILFSVDNNINNKNVEYIRSFGYEVDPNPTEIAHITIPKEFDIIYETYNEIAKKSGFDLTEHKGTRATRYTYKVINYSESDNGLIRANVFVSGDDIIAADLCSLGINGFTKPLHHK